MNTNSTATSPSQDEALVTTRDVALVGKLDDRDRPAANHDEPARIMEAPARPPPGYRPVGPLPWFEP